MGRRIVLALAFASAGLLLLAVRSQAGWAAVLATLCILVVLLAHGVVVIPLWLTALDAAALLVVTVSTFVTVHYALVPYSVRGVACGDAMTVQADLGDRPAQRPDEEACLERADLRLLAAAGGAGALTLSVLPYLLATRSEEP